MGISKKKKIPLKLQTFLYIHSCMQISMYVCMYMLPLSGIDTKKGYIDDLEKVQRRATKLLQNISHLSYPERLAALNLPTLVYCRIRGDMIETFKILNNIYDSRATNFLSKKTNFQQQEVITSSCLYNTQTLTSENGSSQFVLSTSGIVFLQTL